MVALIFGSLFFSLFDLPSLICPFGCQCSGNSGWKSYAIYYFFSVQTIQIMCRSMSIHHCRRCSKNISSTFVYFLCRFVDVACNRTVRICFNGNVVNNCGVCLIWSGCVYLAIFTLLKVFCVMSQCYSMWFNGDSEVVNSVQFSQLDTLVDHFKPATWRLHLFSHSTLWPFFTALYFCHARFLLYGVSVCAFVCGAGATKVIGYLTDLLGDFNLCIRI